jgi:hypothetical protein
MKKILQKKHMYGSAHVYLDPLFFVIYVACMLFYRELNRKYMYGSAHGRTYPPSCPAAAQASGRAASCIFYVFARIWYCLTLFNTV